MPKRVDHGLRREAFFAAANRTIKRKGLSGVTVRAVAREAGFTTGALVHYVESVDRLLVEAADYAARDMRAGMDNLERLPDRLDALRQVLYLALPSDDDKRSHWNFWLGFWERSLRNAAMRRATHLRYTEWIERMARLIRQAQDAGDLARDVDPHRASRACVALIDGIAVQAMRSGHPLPAKQQREIVDEWIRSWLRPPRWFELAEPQRSGVRRL